MLDATGHDPSQATTIQVERFADIVAPLRVLFTDMWSDMSRDISLPPLDVNYDGYVRLEAAGVLRTFTVRLRGALVGAAVFFVSPSMHYGGTKWASSDVIWIRPDMRRPLLGYRLLKFAEDAMQREGVTVLRMGAQLARPELGRLLVYMGYNAAEVHYQKVLP